LLAFVVVLVIVDSLWCVWVSVSMAPAGPTLPPTLARIVLLDTDGQDEGLETPVLVAACTPVAAGLTPVLVEPPQTACAAPDAPSATAKTSEARKAPLEIAGGLEVEANVFRLPRNGNQPKQKSFRIIVLRTPLWCTGATRLLKRDQG
jgi:hypothetical protein